MNLYICGLIDIVLIIGFIVIVIVGYKTGLIKKLLDLINALCGVLMSLILSPRLATALNKTALSTAINNKIFNNIMAKDALAGMGENQEVAVADLLKELGLPNFIAKSVSQALAENVDVIDIVKAIADKITYVVLIIISFFFLLIGVSIIVKLLKFVVKLIRDGVTSIRIIDGILGAIFLSGIYLIGIYLVFFILSLLMQIPGFASGVGNFIINDLQLNNDKFRISKYFYENNIIGNLINLVL